MNLKMSIIGNNDVNKYDGLAQAIVGMNGRLDLSNRLWFVATPKLAGKATWMGFGGYREIDAERVYFGPTFVKEDYRGVGIQSRLISARLKQAKKDSYKEAISSIYAYNHRSGNNLIEAGFRMCQIPRYYDIEVDEVWFKKAIL